MKHPLSALWDPLTFWNVVTGSGSSFGNGLQLCWLWKYTQSFSGIALVDTKQSQWLIWNFGCANQWLTGVRNISKSCLICLCKINLRDWKGWQCERNSLGSSLLLCGSFCVTPWRQEHPLCFGMEMFNNIFHYMSFNSFNFNFTFLTLNFCYVKSVLLLI